MHLSLPVPQVFNESSLIVAPALPSIDPFTISFVVDIGPLILLSPKLPNSIPESESVLEFSLVDRPVAPSIGSAAFWFAI